MMRLTNAVRSWTILSSVFVCGVGCESQQDSVRKQAESELVVSDLNQSQSPLSVSEAIEAATKSTDSTDAVPASQPVLLKAKVGSGKGETFDPAISAFLVSEIPAGEHADSVSHDSSNCPFCRAREAKAPTVMVRLIGKNGEPYPKSADQLLGLTKGQHVVVEGTGQYDSELNFYTVEANKIQILK